MNVAVRIQHVGTRAHLLPELLAALDGFDDVRVIADPGGRRPSSWRTHRLCLESAPEDRPTLVLQDDALPCARFHVKATAAIEAHPEAIVVLFLPGFPNQRVATEKVRRTGAGSFPLVVGAYLPLVAVVYPPGIPERVLAFADKKRITPSRADDAVIATFARSQRVPVVALAPSLVEHRTDVPSAMGMPNRGDAHRSACWFEP